MNLNYSLNFYQTATPVSKPFKKRPAGGAIYLSRIPHGFEEDGMEKYFSQFGEVTKVCLGRSKKVSLYFEC